MCHIRIHRAIYQWSNYVRTKYIDYNRRIISSVMQLGFIRIKCDYDHDDVPSLNLKLVQKFEIVIATSHLSI